MPSTLPGFLMLAGVLIFVGSFFTKALRYKDTELPALSAASRRTLRYFGVGLMAVSLSLYTLGLLGLIDVKTNLMLSPPP